MNNHPILRFSVLLLAVAFSSQPQPARAAETAPAVPPEIVASPAALRAPNYEEALALAQGTGRALVVLQRGSDWIPRGAHLHGAVAGPGLCRGTREGFCAGGGGQSGGPRRPGGARALHRGKVRRDGSLRDAHRLPSRPCASPGPRRTPRRCRTARSPPWNRRKRWCTPGRTGPSRWTSRRRRIPRRTRSS